MLTLLSLELPMDVLTNQSQKLVDFFFDKLGNEETLKKAGSPRTRNYD